VVLVAAGVLLATQLPASSHSHAETAPTPDPTQTALVAPSRSFHDAVSSYIGRREGKISVAVYDHATKHLTVVRPKVRGRTASIVKVDILETLLHKTAGHLSEDQRETAIAMIENSDNDAATKLWNEDGGAPGVGAYNDDVGLKQTDPDVDWGLTTTSAKDQVTLIRELFHTGLLTSSGRNLQRRLMRHVEADQRWGISGGLPKSANFGVKNGWLPVSEDHDRWAVNSIGWVHGDGKRYEIAVITQHNDAEGYGIHTIEHIAALAWKDAAVAGPQ
jgi:beta-lactamase class A